MVMIILGFLVGAFIGLIRAIIGETMYKILTTALGLYLAYMFFSIFGLFWGFIIIIGVVSFLLLGAYEVARDAKSTILGRK